MTLTLEVGSARVSLQDLMNLGPDSVVELDSLAGTPLVIKVNGVDVFKPQTGEVISHGADGKPFTKTQQVHMCGNSVSPPPLAALARANLDPARLPERMAA